MIKEKFKIIFWQVQANEKGFIIPNIDLYLSYAIVTKSTDNFTEIYHIELEDIGLSSLFGEFDLIRENNLWQISDQDSQEFRLIKSSIIEAIEFQLK
jgi:hypothetical protein